VVNTALVWLLLVANPGYAGAVVHTQAPMFKTAADCERVGKASQQIAKWAEWRCVQAEVVVTEPKTNPQPAPQALKGH
jgi:hypothetical protein